MCNYKFRLKKGQSIINISLLGLTLVRDPGDLRLDLGLVAEIIIFHELQIFIKLNDQRDRRRDIQPRDIRIADTF